MKGKNRNPLYVVLLTIALVVIIWFIAQEMEEEPVLDPITVTDSAGREITIEEAPEKIVSGAPANTEILYALGLGDQIVGVTDWCNYPLEAMDKPTVGGFSDINLEKVVELDPHIVFGAIGVQGPLIQSFEDAGIVFVAIEPETLDELIDSIELIGAIAGKEQEAQELISDMESRIDAVKEKVVDIPEDERPGVLYEVWNDPVMTIGPNTYISDMIEIAGGRNIFSDAQDNWPVVDIESILARDPQVIISSMHHHRSGPDEFYQMNTWSEISAIRNKRVYVVSDGDVFARVGPRIIDGLEEFARYIHPDLF